MKQTDPNLELPERLERLNRELGTEAVKRCDRLYATRREHRIEVTITRRDKRPKHHAGEKDYYAVAEFSGQRFFCYGLLPSHAFVRVVKQLEWAVAKYDFEVMSNSNVVSLAERRAA